jgi:hypothetical protein
MNAARSSCRRGWRGSTNLDQVVPEARVLGREERSGGPCQQHLGDALPPGSPRLGSTAGPGLQIRCALGDRASPRGLGSGVLGHCHGPVASAGVPPGASPYAFWGWEVIRNQEAHAETKRSTACCQAICPPRKRHIVNMPPKKKDLSPESRRKADKRNERLQLGREAKRASDGEPRQPKAISAWTRQLAPPGPGVLK